MLQRRSTEEEKGTHWTKGAPDGRDRFRPTMATRRATGVLQRPVDDVGWKSAHAGGNDRDALFVPTIVMRRAGGVLQRDGGKIQYVES